jgi:hypothetical protein
MTKVFKIIGSILGIFLEWLIIFVFLFAFLIRTSEFQTYLAQLGTEFLSSELDTKMSIEKLDILFFDRVELKGVHLEDKQKDTLANIQSIIVNINILDLSKQIFALEDLKISKGTIKINRSAKDGKYNYAFLEEYFASKEKKKKTSPFELKIDQVSLIDIQFYYDDFRKKEMNKGIDWNHIKAKNLYVSASDFFVDLNDFRVNINEIRFQEKSGFSINQLAAQVIVNKKGIQLENLEICTNESELTASKLNLLYNKQVDFEDFENKVRFDANILQSSISLGELAFFSSETEGMSDFVRLRGKVSNTINQLTLTDFSIGFGKVSKIEGDFKLPDFTDLANLTFDETIEYAYVSVEDISNFKLPKSSGIEKLNLGKEVERLAFFETKNLKCNGKPSDFDILFESTKTKLGEVKLNAPFQIISNGKMEFNTRTNSGQDIQFIDFKLGELLADNSLNTIDGAVSFQSTYYPNGNFEISRLDGKVNRFDIQDYSLHNATISNGSLINQVLQSDIQLDDDILKLTYTGYIDLKGDKKLNFSINLTEALLNKLNLARSKKATLLKSSIDVDLNGLDPSTMSGDVIFTGFVYKEGSEEIDIPKIQLSIKRNKTEDIFLINGDNLIDLEIKGKFDLKSIGNEFTNQLSNAFPFLAKTFPKKTVSKNNKFKYRLTFLNGNEFLARFFPSIKNFHIAPNSYIDGEYSAADELFTMNIVAKEGIRFNDIKLGSFEFKQLITKDNLNFKLELGNVSYAKKVNFNSISFKTLNESSRKDLLTSEINWITSDNINSNLSWLTTLKDENNFDINMNESDFSINGQSWHIGESAFISYNPEAIKIENFLLTNEQQKIGLNGNISNQSSDSLAFNLENIDLAAIDQLLGLKQGLQGTVKGSGVVSDPFNNISVTGKLDIGQLKVQKQQIGDVRAEIDWKPQPSEYDEHISLRGDIQNNNKTNFIYYGKFYLKRPKENLDFDLIFSNFDIGFANAYVDKDVISNIRGLVTGKIKISGTPNKPKFTSNNFALQKAKAKIEILGTTLSLNGKFNLENNDVYGHQIEVLDEENNKALLNFAFNNFLGKWNYDIGIDINERINPSNRFIVLNTKYKDGDYYYGKVYGSGNCNISGNEDQLDIFVDIKTAKGSKLILPLYGVSEIDEEDDFIAFVNSNTIIDTIKKIDFTGVKLDLNFDVTNDTELNVVFNDQTQDKIVSFGSGKVNMKIDDTDNDIKMTGKYNIDKGSKYNFAIGQFKKEFNIESGSFIEWTDNIEDATISITTYFNTKTDYGALAPELEETSLANQNVNCQLLLKGQLLKPEISFNLKADDNIPETGKALINRVLDEQSEVNRQFFSLLAFDRFQPLKGNISAGGSAALDLAEAQINDLFSKVSEEFKMKMNLNKQDIEFTTEKRFLEDRLIISTSVGVETGSNDTESTNTSSTSRNTIIGDVRVEYLINEKGTFRINAFNESNRNTVNQSAGLFSQGAGLNYQEDFNGLKDFQLLQSFLDIFRPKRNKKIKTKKKKKQVKVSEVDINKSKNKPSLPTDKEIKN